LRAILVSVEARLKLERLALTGIGVGVLLRLASPFIMDLGYDANAYVATGYGWMRTHHLLLPYGDVLTFWPSGPGYSHHFPPGYPFYLGLVFATLGYGLAQAKLAAVAISLLALVVTWWATRDLYGREAAALTTAVVAVTPWLFWLTGMGFSENLALILFTLTMWAIVRSLENERFILLAGLFAGLAYLTRSSMGAFFLIAGGGGALWRLYHRGWRAFRSPWYGAAVVLFGAILGAWAWRNLALFGWPNWETSTGSRGIPEWIWDHKLQFALSTFARVPMMLAVLLPLPLFLRPEARAAVRRLREEHASALWLSVFLVWFLAVLFSAAYLSMGAWEDALRLDNFRYVVIAIVPLTWLLARDSDCGDPRTRRRWLALGIVLLVGCATVAIYPAHDLSSEAARALDPALQKGDVILVDGTGKYAFFAYLTHPEDVSVHLAGYVPQDEPAPPFVIQRWQGARDGYVLLGEKLERHPWFAPDDYVVIYGRADVVAARGIVLEPMRAGW